jgi:uncharacterized protein (TIGR04255 family)
LQDKTEKEIMHYARNYITKAIARLDFIHLPLGPIVSPSPFSARIAARFPQWDAKPLSELRIAVSPDGAGVNHMTTGTQITHVKQPNGTVQAVLGPTFLTLEYGSGDYGTFDGFFEDLQSLYAALSVTYPTARPSRIGLRYINEITGDGDALQWAGEVSPGLAVASTAGLIDGARLLRSVLQTTLKRDENTATVHSGIWNPDFPNPAVQKHFVIDVDCYRENIDVAADILGAFRSMNVLASEIFEHSIDAGLRTKMEIIHE